MADPASPNLFTVAAPYVSPIVSVLGSFFVSKFTAKAVSKRAAAKQAFGEILKTLDSLEEAVVDLLLIAGSDQKASSLFRRICIADDRLGRRISELFSAHQSKSRLAGSDPVPPRVSNSLIALRAVATADELVSAARPAYMANAQNFRLISDRVSDLRGKLREEADEMKCGDLE